MFKTTIRTETSLMLCRSKFFSCKYLASIQQKTMRTSCVSGYNVSVALNLTLQFAGNSKGQFLLTSTGKWQKLTWDVKFSVGRATLPNFRISLDSISLKVKTWT